MSAKNTTEIVRKLRYLMKQRDVVGGQALQAYLVPSGDAHQNEYIADCDKRRAFITGFTGSAGTAIVTEQDACLWTDGRYFLQAAQQMDDNWKLMRQGVIGTPTQEEWLSKELNPGSRVGVDPYLYSADTWKSLNEALSLAGHSLVPVAKNLVDLIWGENRPDMPNNDLIIQGVEYSGVTFKAKIEDLRKEMKEKSASYLVVTALDEIAWLFNLRGSDIDYNPVFFAYAVVGLSSVHLFIDDKKVSESIRQHLDNGISVVVKPYGEITEFLSHLYQNDKETKKTWVSGSSSYALVSLIPKRNCILKPCPITESKAVKNAVEIKGMRTAHIKDAVALCEYFSWLEKEVPNGQVTEISGATRLEELRKEQEGYVSMSFPTISSSGSNGAVIHYQPSPETDKLITTQELYLCDSGAQFRDGTTDVTRTVHFGTPSQHEKECYTRVLKGVIALATCVFPTGTKGSRLDALARQALWDVGLDYLHGTGHGVGSFLNVHEGPQRVGYRIDVKEVGLKKGMFISDEPGYYEDGAFGIRIENIVEVIETETKFNFRDMKYLTFDTVTLVPLQRKMIEPSLLTEKEINWINTYHENCLASVGEELQHQGRTKTLKWLQTQTEPLG